MPRRPIRIVPAAALSDDFERIRREAALQTGFPADAEAEARAVRRRPGESERVELPFATIDPPGARDLDQALHIERRGDGHRVRYAIADVAAFVAAGGAIDRESHARGVTVYTPDRKAPLHPPAISEGAASLLPDRWRPAVLWTLDLDARGELRAADVARKEIRSVAQHTYVDVPDELATLLAEVGGRRLELERARGGVRLEVPEQQVVEEDGAWTVRYRVPLATEEHNAQISLLTGIAAAQLMIDYGCGILRTQPPPDDRSLTRFRRQARALGVDWPRELPYPDFIRSLDGSLPRHAAVLHEATSVARAAGYVAFDGELPERHQHFAIATAYAHATAPLRRLQDRYVSECCLAACAGSAPPDWVRAGLGALPAEMAAASQRARRIERSIVDLVEATLLAGREGERFKAVVVDDALVQLTEPAVRGPLDGNAPEPGSEVRVRLDVADPATRTVRFSVV